MSKPTIMALYPLSTSDDPIDPAKQNASFKKAVKSVGERSISMHFYLFLFLFLSVGSECTRDLCRSLARVLEQTLRCISFLFDTSSLRVGAATVLNRSFTFSSAPLTCFTCGVGRIPLPYILKQPRAVFNRSRRFFFASHEVHLQKAEAVRRPYPGGTTRVKCLCILPSHQVVWCSVASAR